MRVAKDQIQFLNKYIFYLHYINKIKTNNKQQLKLKFDNTNATLACTMYLLGQFVHTKEDFLFFPTQCNSPEHDTIQNQTLQFPSLDVLSSSRNAMELNPLCSRISQDIHLRVYGNKKGHALEYGASILNKNASPNTITTCYNVP